MNIINFDQIKKSDLKLVGGKGLSLGELTKIGISVPSGFVVSAKVFKAFKDKSLSEGVQKEILGAFDKLGVKKVAVRSSAICEDSKESSWAGQLETYLNIDRDNLLESIRKCWRSIKSQRVKEYAALTGMREEDLLVAVVIQKMVDSESAGILFTANPIAKNYNEIMVDFGYGLGELIVQGMITPSSFIIDKDTLGIKKRYLKAQEKMLISVDGGGKEVEVPIEKKNKPALSDDEIIKLAKIAIKIEKHYKIPQDIEWAIERGKLYIVQSRPITTL